MAKVDVEYVSGLRLLYRSNSTESRTLLLVASDGKNGQSAMPFTSWFISPTEPGWCFSAYLIVTNCSQELVKRTGQFTVNLPRDGMEQITDYCGSVSGRDHDKFSECGLAALPSRGVTPPIIGECGVHLEMASLIAATGNLAMT